MNNAWNSDEQCVNSDFCLCTVNPCEVTIHVQEKKKKRQNVKLENATIILIQTLTKYEKV